MVLGRRQMHGKRPTRSLLVLACTAVLSRCPVSTSRCTSGLLQTAHDRRHQRRTSLGSSHYTQIPFPSPLYPQSPPLFPSHHSFFPTSPNRRHAPAPRLRNFLFFFRHHDLRPSVPRRVSRKRPFHPFTLRFASAFYKLPISAFLFFLSLSLPSQLEISVSLARIVS